MIRPLERRRASEKFEADTPPLEFRLPRFRQCRLILFSLGLI